MLNVTKKLRTLVVGCLFLIVAIPANAIESFVIENIRVEGLQSVAVGAIFVALPMRVGDEFNDQLSASSIQALYATGLFNDVQLRREGNDLVVSVIERPTISELSFSGNKKMSDDSVEASLTANDIVRVGIYNPEIVETFVRRLKQEYTAIGRFSVIVNVAVVPQPRNRVDLTFDIYEGPIALIKEIRFIGNSQLSDEELLDLMQVSTKKSLGFLNRKNRYNAEKLRADLETIITHYHGMGFISFEIISSRAFISDDRSRVLIIITMSEGLQFKFGNISVDSRREIIPNEQLEEEIQVQSGDHYSFQGVNSTRTQLTNKFANLGYARAQVDPLPQVNDEAGTVDVNFVVNPGQLTYIRRITIVGNLVTDDEVIRREMRMFEGSVYSVSAIAQSRLRLQRLGFFSRIDLRAEEVPGVNDQIDLVVSVKEELTGSLLFGVGYSDSEKFSFSASITQKNLFGTGKEISASANFGQANSSLEFDYLNPYYTLDGVSRGFTVRYSKSDTDDTSYATIYGLDQTVFGVQYLFPVQEENSVGIKMSAENYELQKGPSSGDYFIGQFVQENSKGTTGSFRISYNQDSRNRAFFPSKGHELNLSAELTTGNLRYYILRSRYAKYIPVGSTSMGFSGRIDYGDNFQGDDYGGLPFFRNFYMSGNYSVRGFDSAALGPKEICSSDGQNFTRCSSARSVGGNLRILGRAELYLPFFGTKDSADKRFSIFIDAGNVFGVAPDLVKSVRHEFGYDNVSLNNLRISTGAAFQWLSPIGPFGISYGIPVRSKRGDEENRFQFTLGTFFN